MSVDVGGVQVRVTHLDKVMYPATGTTKADVIGYVVGAGEALLRQLRDRPVTRVRFPGGTGGPRFFEKNVPAGAPAWLRHRRMPADPFAADSVELDLPFLDDLAGLVWAANAGALELHTPQWTTGRRGSRHGADRLVVDLDPGAGAGLDACARVAHLVADRLAADGLTRTVPVTSGSKGLQLYAPLPRATPPEELNAYARAIAHELAGAHPDAVVAVQERARRTGRVLIDWSQNSPAKTTITPYSLRGGAAPLVAAPRRWDEIGPGLAQLGCDQVLARLAAGTEPFTG